jgi:hypothetical protein
MTVGDKEVEVGVQEVDCKGLMKRWIVEVEEVDCRGGRGGL